MMKQISPKEIRAAFAALAPELFVHVPDREYDCPSREWLMDKYTEWFITQQHKMGVQKYVDDCNDCDDYASRYRVGVQIFNSKRVWSHVLKKLVGLMPDACPIAVGEIWYKKAVGTKHAINCAFVNEDRELIFIEPQKRKQISLTKGELNSIFFVRF
jgi:hypothetical protein